MKRRNEYLEGCLILKDKEEAFKQVQKVQLEILLEFDRICKKNNIKYSLFAGTLLGAVRHEGFIPWDDDIDVCLLREDYEKFLKISELELNSKYFLQNYKTDQNYVLQFSKIRKNKTVFLEKTLSECKIHHGIYIDVFPLDNVKKKSFKGKIQQSFLCLIGRVNLTRIKYLCINNSNIIQKMIRLASHYFLKIVPKRTMNWILKKLFYMFNNKKCEFASHLTNGVTKKRMERYTIKRNDFLDMVEGQFEGYSFPIQKNFDLVLTKMYGNYMKLPPLSERAPHHGIVEIKIEDNKH